MKQILLRVPDDVHRHLAAHAARSGRSVNAVATAILDAAVDAENGDRRTRLRARAALTGLLRSASADAVTETHRAEIITSTRGLGRLLDGLLAEERERV